MNVKLFFIKIYYKNNPQSSLKRYKYQKADNNNDDNKYEKLVNNLNKMALVLKKLLKKVRSLGLELTQFMHSDIALVEQIIKESSRDAGINKNIKKDIKVADLDAISEIDDDLKKNQKQFMIEKNKKWIQYHNSISFRPFLASREEFFKGAILLQNDSEFIIRENLFLNLNLKYNLKDNFDDLKYPPVDTYPAQVRSDIKDYLGNMEVKVF